MKIKIRAWDMKNKEMIYIDDFYWFEENGVHNSEGKGHHANYELMLNTGIKDKNGREIYDGDIVSTDLSRPYLIVVFRNGAFMYQCHDSDKDYYDIMLPIDADIKQDKYSKVLGNIYENPELIKL